MPRGRPRSILWGWARGPRASLQLFDVEQNISILCPLVKLGRHEFIYIYIQYLILPGILWQHPKENRPLAWLMDVVKQICSQPRFLQDNPTPDWRWEPRSELSRQGVCFTNEKWCAVHMKHYEIWATHTCACMSVLERMFHSKLLDSSVVLARFYHATISRDNLRPWSAKENFVQEDGERRVPDVEEWGRRRLVQPLVSANEATPKVAWHRLFRNGIDSASHLQARWGTANYPEEPAWRCHQLGCR